MGFAASLERDDFALVAEVDPPKGADLEGFVKTALSIKGRVSAIAVTDGASAIMRMTPLAPCRKLIENKVDPIMMINGRDRNRISFQGDLLSAYALGVRSVLLKRGQDPAVGDQPMASDSQDLDLQVMLKAVSSLNEGVDLGGEALSQKTQLIPGVFLDVSDDINLNRKAAQSLAQYAAEGVRFVVLGPTYDANIVKLFSDRAGELGLRLMASVMCLKSVAMIRYLNNMPGVPSVPNEYLKQMINAPVKQQAGLDIAVSFIQDLKDCCHGAFLIALGWGSRLSECLDRLGR